MVRLQHRSGTALFAEPYRSSLRPHRHPPAAQKPRNAGEFWDRPFDHPSSCSFTNANAMCTVSWSHPSGGGLIFTWSGENLSRRRIDSRKPGMLTSSSWRPASVVTARHAVFREWSRNHLSPKMSDHLDFHTTSEHPRGTAWAVCMSRAEARSVSLNCVTISGSRAIMTHQARHEGARGFNRKIHRTKLALPSAP